MSRASDAARGRPGRGRARRGRRPTRPRRGQARGRDAASARALDVAEAALGAEPDGARGDAARARTAHEHPGLGPTRVDASWTQLGISDTKRVGGLGVRQRDKLRDYLESARGQRRAAASRLVVLAGPTAVGKGTVSRYIRENYPDVLLSVSATTRAPRPGEVDGEHYYFVSRRRVRPDDRARRVPRVRDRAQRLPLRHAAAADRRRARRRARACCSRSTCRARASVRAAMPEALLVFLLPPTLGGTGAAADRPGHRGRRPSRPAGSRPRGSNWRPRTSSM